MAIATAAWVIAENKLPGSDGWAPGGIQRPFALEGYTSAVSGIRGESVHLMVSTTEPSFSVQVWRLGYYNGAGGRLVTTLGPFTGHKQAMPIPTADRRMVECAWDPSTTFTIDQRWVPGIYLLKLVSPAGQQHLVPFTVRDDTRKAAYAFMNSVTTWQAYNLWGDYSLYYGRDSSGKSTFAARAHAVSFDRPWLLSWNYGGSDLLGAELPLARLMEKHGADVTYTTNVDLHARPQLLANYRSLLSLGHDEYWSSVMYDQVLTARDKGLNLAFFGSNAVYRHIRFEDGPSGSNRREICYKDPTIDPLYGVNNAEVTADWPSGPKPRPEGILIGNSYASNPVKAPLVVADANHWVWKGAGVKAGTSLVNGIQSEYDKYDPTVAGVPSDVDIVAHSPVLCNGNADYSDATWTTIPGGGGVFATGTNAWINRLSDVPRGPQNSTQPGAVRNVTRPLTLATLNVLSVLGGPPASQTRPAGKTWTRFYRADGVPTQPSRPGLQNASPESEGTS